MSELLGQLAEILAGPFFDSQSRARLYLEGKREDRIVASLSEALMRLDHKRKIIAEHRLKPDELAAWNLSLESRGFFSGASGLRKKKSSGRVDLTSVDQNDLPIALFEVKAWSATDAVDETRYLESKQYNHSILKSFEIDALKMLAVNAAEDATSVIVTALFTIHCDGLSNAQLAEKGLSYVSLLNKQNSDKAKIGNSDDYRDAGVNRVMNQFEVNFGSGTEINAKFAHVPAFSRNQAALSGVGLSLDLIGAELHRKLD
jgi:hypothetical protein